MTRVKRKSTTKMKMNWSKRKTWKEMNLRKKMNHFMEKKMMKAQQKNPESFIKIFNS